MAMIHGKGRGGPFIIFVKWLNIFQLIQEDVVAGVFGEGGG